MAAEKNESVMVAYGLYCIVFIITWHINLYKFCMCEFEEFGRKEIIHLVGVINPFASVMTVWF